METAKTNPGQGPTLLLFADQGGSADAFFLAYRLAAEMGRQGRRPCLVDVTGSASALAQRLGCSATREPLSPGSPCAEFCHRYSLSGGVALLEDVTGNLDNERLAVTGLAETDLFDYVFLLLPKDMSKRSFRLLKAAGDMVVLVDSAPRSFTKAFSLIRLHRRAGTRSRIFLVSAGVAAAEEGAVLHQRFVSVGRMFLREDVVHFGSVYRGFAAWGDPGEISPGRQRRQEEALRVMAATLEQYRLGLVPATGSSDVEAASTHKVPEATVPAEASLDTSAVEVAVSAGALSASLPRIDAEEGVVGAAATGPAESGDDLRGPGLVREYLKRIKEDVYAERLASRDLRQLSGHIGRMGLGKEADKKDPLAGLRAAALDAARLGQREQKAL